MEEDEIGTKFVCELDGNRAVRSFANHLAPVLYDHLDGEAKGVVVFG
jgi:hypothetical protein